MKRYLAHPTDFEEFKKLFEKTNKGAAKFSLALSLLTREKALNKTKWEFCPFADDDASRGLLGIGFNLTKDINFLQRHVATIIESLSEGFVIQDKNGKIIGSNQRAVEILGLPQKEMHGRTSKDKRWKAITEAGTTFPGEEHPPMQALRSKKSIQNFVMGIHQKKGDLRWLLVNAQPIFLNGSSKPEAVVSLFNDITEGKEAEMRLKETNQFLQHLFATVSNTIWEYDFKKGFAFHNESFRKLFGYAPGKLFYSRSWWLSKLHPADRKKAHAILRQALKKKQHYWECEYRFLAKNGEYKNILDKASIIYFENKPARMIGAMQDMTDKRYLEEQLLKMAVATKQEIIDATIIAQEKEKHELGRELHDNVNQLLAVARLYIDIAEKQGALETYLPKAKEYLENAIQEIRKVSRQLALNVKEFGLLTSIQSLVKDLSIQQQFRVVFHHNTFDEKIIPPNIAVSVYRVFQEKIRNIMKYSQAQTVTIQLTVKRKQLFLKINDDGIGFDLSEKRNGIGLSNIYNRIENMNGTIDLKAAKGKGVDMQIIIPLVQSLKKNSENDLAILKLDEKMA